IKEQFQNIKTSMDEMNKGMTQFETVQKSVIDLNKVFKSNKNIGSYGELTLSKIFEHHFSGLKNKFWFEQYNIDDSKKEKVDFVIKSKNLVQDKNGSVEQEIIIPIDSKFPLDSWKRYDEEDKSDLKNKLFEEFKNNIFSKAKDIASKYINISKNTTPWAIMYIPVETIYLDLIKNDSEFVQKLFKNQKIYILGPTNIMAFIYNFFMQNNSYYISKQIEKVRDLFIEIQDSYYKLTASMDRSVKQIENAKKTLLIAQNHSDTVINKINKQAKELKLEKTNIKAIKASISEENEE
ncbi:DNA recombination protein RmuC, partial [Mycoplasma tauri]|uniref:DNA recombination protein RmuC n=1 Tax=Mycoplasma tauri TaxID=547987 RepID=UPI001CBEE821